MLDENLSPYLAYGIKELSANEPNVGEVVHITDKFANGTPDQDWILQLAQEGGWVSISQDRKILKTPHLLSIYKANGVSGFFLKKAWMDVGYWSQAHHLVKRWPEILANSRTIRAGFCFYLPLNGKLIPI